MSLQGEFVEPSCPSQSRPWTLGYASSPECFHKPELHGTTQHAVRIHKHTPGNMNRHSNTSTRMSMMAFRYIHPSPREKMIDSLAGGTEKRRRPPSDATLLQTVERIVHIHDLSTACRLADVLIHARQSAKRCETQRRHAAAPSSRERSPWRDHRPRCP
eukprot:350631-Chlamydomonas_euryale.AAC.10